VSGPGLIPTKALPGFLAFLAEHGLTDAELLNRSAEIAEGPLSSFDYELIADALDVLDPDGSEQTRRKQELEAWARQMAATGRGHLPTVADRGAELLRAAMALINAYGGDVPDWLRGEADALLRACADFDGFPGARPTRVVVTMEGGCVQGVVADRGGLLIRTLDYDIEGISGSDDEPLWNVPQDDGRTAEGYRSDPFEPDVDPAWIEAFENAERVPFDIDEARWRGCSDQEIARLIEKSDPATAAQLRAGTYQPEQLTETPRADPLRHVVIEDEADADA
jgi:hypothetical protein